MDKINAVLDRLPKFYSKDQQSVLYNVIKSITDEYDIANIGYIGRADSDIGVDTTTGADLDWRWGSLLSVDRIPNESDDSYRKRLASSVGKLHGGTADSIQYVVSVFLGIIDSQGDIGDNIKIYDAWKYDGTGILEEDKVYGHIVCTFEPSVVTRDIYYQGIESDILKYIDSAKATGIIAHVIVKFTSYGTLSKYTHSQLAPYTHDQLAKWSLS